MPTRHPDPEPSQWRAHQFGLSDQRWQRLEGRSYWVTGAGTGIGRAISIALACAGAQVFLTGRRLPKLEQTILEIEALGVATAECHAVPADITDATQVAAACEYVRSHALWLSGLVNNAAAVQRHQHASPLQQEDPDYLDEILRINVTAQLRVTRAILPHMVVRPGARILFMTSAAGWSFAVGAGQYNVSKAALNSLAACLASECEARHHGRDLQINTLDPGQVHSEMNPAAPRSPFATVPMALLLLTQPVGGPNGRFFVHDGGSRAFGIAPPYDEPLD